MSTKASPRRGGRLEVRRGWLWLLTLLPLLAIASPIAAHGGGLIYAAGESAGPYRVTVWAAPDRVEAGKTLHFTVAVIQPEDNRPVLDGQVWVTVGREGETTAVLSGPATTEQSVNKLFYEVDFVAPAEAGEYWVVTAVSGDAGSGELSFILTVEPARGGNLFLFGLAALLLLTAIGLYWLRRQAQPNPSMRS
jgi:hypothetical protein